MACSPATLLLSRDGSRACTQVTPRGTSSVSTARSPGTRRGSSSGSTTARSPLTSPPSRNGPAARAPARLGATGSSTAGSPGTRRGAGTVAAASVDRAAEPSTARAPASQPSREGSQACTPATRSADWAPLPGASSPGTTGSGGARRRTPRKRGPAPSAQQTGAGRGEGSRRRSEWRANRPNHPIVCVLVI